MLPMFAKLVPSEKHPPNQDFMIEGRNDGRHADRQVLMLRQCGEVGVEISWDRRSGFIRGRVYRGGRAFSAIVCGMPKRRMEMGELSVARKYFKGVIVRVHGWQIDVQPRLLGGVQTREDRDSVHPKLKEEKLEDILLGATGARGNRRVYQKELDRRFKKYERWAQWTEEKEGANLCHARNQFLILAKSDDINVFTRAMNGLIYALEKDPFERATADNIKNIYEVLWNKFNDLSGASVIKLEKLTRAFGLAQTTNTNGIERTLPGG